MKKIGLFVVAALSALVAMADTIIPTMVPGGTGGWTVASGSGLKIGLRARNKTSVVSEDKKGAQLVSQGLSVLEFSIGSNQTLAPLDPSIGYFKFYLKTEGKKDSIVEPLFNWNDNYFMAPDGNVFQGPASWYVVVSNLAQGSHDLLSSGRYTLYAVPSNAGPSVLKVWIEVKYIK